MAKSIISSVLESQLGKYVDGLKAESLQVGLWQGKLLLEDLSLKDNALDEFSLPIRLVRGHIRKVEVYVPWNHLGSESVTITIEGLTILAVPETKIPSKADILPWKARNLELKELARQHLRMLRTDSQAHAKQTKENTTFFSRLTSRIIDNLQVTFTDLNFCYQENGQSVGVTLASFTYRTTDENGREVFVDHAPVSTSKFLHKRARMDSLAVYCDGITNPGPDEHSYILRPTSMSLRIIKNESLDYTERPKLELLLDIQRLEVGADADQVNTAATMTEHMASRQTLHACQYEKWMHVSFSTPREGSVSGHAQQWWLFAVQCVRHELGHRNSTRSTFRWPRIRTFGHSRRLYGALFGFVALCRKEKVHEENDGSGIDEQRIFVHMDPSQVALLEGDAFFLAMVQNEDVNLTDLDRELARMESVDLFWNEVLIRVRDVEQDRVEKAWEAKVKREEENSWYNYFFSSGSKKSEEKPSAEQKEENVLSEKGLQELKEVYDRTKERDEEEERTVGDTEVLYAVKCTLGKGRFVLRGGNSMSQHGRSIVESLAMEWTGGFECKKSKSVAEVRSTLASFSVTKTVLEQELWPASPLSVVIVQPSEGAQDPTRCLELVCAYHSASKEGLISTPASLDLSITTFVSFHAVLELETLLFITGFAPLSRTPAQVTTQQVTNADGNESRTGVMFQSVMEYYPWDDEQQNHNPTLTGGTEDRVLPMRWNIHIDVKAPMFYLPSPELVQCMFLAEWQARDGGAKPAVLTSEHFLDEKYTNEPNCALVSFDLGQLKVDTVRGSLEEWRAEVSDISVELVHDTTVLNRFHIAVDVVYRSSQHTLEAKMHLSLLDVEVSEASLLQFARLQRSLGREYAALIEEKSHTSQFSQAEIHTKSKNEMEFDPRIGMDPVRGGSSTSIRSPKRNRGKKGATSLSTAVRFQLSTEIQEFRCTVKELISVRLVRFRTELSSHGPHMTFQARLKEVQVNDLFHMSSSPYAAIVSCTQSPVDGDVAPDLIDIRVQYDAYIDHVEPIEGGTSHGEVFVGGPNRVVVDFHTLYVQWNPSTIFSLYQLLNGYFELCFSDQTGPYLIENASTSPVVESVETEGGGRDWQIDVSIHEVSLQLNKNQHDRVLQSVSLSQAKLQGRCSPSWQLLQGKGHFEGVRVRDFSTNATNYETLLEVKQFTSSYTSAADGVNEPNRLELSVESLTGVYLQNQMMELLDYLYEGVLGVLMQDAIMRTTHAFLDLSETTSPGLEKDPGTRVSVCIQTPRLILPVHAHTSYGLELRSDNLRLAHEVVDEKDVKTIMLDACQVLSSKLCSTEMQRSISGTHEHEKDSTPNYLLEKSVEMKIVVVDWCANNVRFQPHSLPFNLSKTKKIFSKHRQVGNDPQKNHEPGEVPMYQPRFQVHVSCSDLVQLNISHASFVMLNGILSDNFNADVVSTSASGTSSFEGQDLVFRPTINYTFDTIDEVVSWSVHFQLEELRLHVIEDSARTLSSATVPRVLTTFSCQQTCIEFFSASQGVRKEDDLPPNLLFSVQSMQCTVPVPSNERSASFVTMFTSRTPLAVFCSWEERPCTSLTKEADEGLVGYTIYVDFKMEEFILTLLPPVVAKLIKFLKIDVVDDVIPCVVPKRSEQRDSSSHQRLSDTCGTVLQTDESEALEPAIQPYLWRVSLQTNHISVRCQDRLDALQSDHLHALCVDGCFTVECTYEEPFNLEEEIRFDLHCAIRGIELYWSLYTATSMHTEGQFLERIQLVEPSNVAIEWTYNQKPLIGRIGERSLDKKKRNRRGAQYRSASHFIKFNFKPIQVYISVQDVFRLMELSSGVINNFELDSNDVVAVLSPSSVSTEPVALEGEQEETQLHARCAFEGLDVIFLNDLKNYEIGIVQFNMKQGDVFLNLNNSSSNHFTNAFSIGFNALFSSKYFATDGRGGWEELTEDYSMNISVQSDPIFYAFVDASQPIVMHCTKQFLQTITSAVDNISKHAAERSSACEKEDVDSPPKPTSAGVLLNDAIKTSTTSCVVQVENATGLDVECYMRDHELHNKASLRRIVVPHRRTVEITLPPVPGRGKGRIRCAKTDENHSRVLCEIEVQGYERVAGVSLEYTGVQSFVLIPKSTGATSISDTASSSPAVSSILVEGKLLDGQLHLVLSSTIRIRNSSEMYPLNLLLNDSSWKAPLELTDYTVEPQSTIYLPIQHVHASELRIRLGPASFFSGLSESRADFAWSSPVSLGLFSRSVSHGNVAPSQRTVNVTSSILDPQSNGSSQRRSRALSTALYTVTERSVCDSELKEVVVTPPVKIRNKLPIQVAFQLNQDAQSAAAAFAQMYGLSSVLESGQERECWLLDEPSRVSLSLSFDAAMAEWTETMDFSANLKKLAQKKGPKRKEVIKVPMNACTDLLLALYVKPDQSVYLELYAEYWLINRTGLQLMYDGGMGSIITDKQGGVATKTNSSRRAPSASQGRSLSSTAASTFSKSAQLLSALPGSSQVKSGFSTIMKTGSSITGINMGTDGGLRRNQFSQTNTVQIGNATISMLSLEGTKKELRLRAVLSEWSTRFQPDPTKLSWHEECLQLISKDGSKLYELGVSVDYSTRFFYNYTTLVSLIPRYLFVNHSTYRVYIKENGDESGRNHHLIPSKAKYAFYWQNGRRTTVSVCIADEQGPISAWSSFISLDKIGLELFELSGVRVEIAVTEGNISEGTFIIHMTTAVESTESVVQSSSLRSGNSTIAESDPQSPSFWDTVQQRGFQLNVQLHEICMYLSDSAKSQPTDKSVTISENTASNAFMKVEIRDIRMEVDQTAAYREAKFVVGNFSIEDRTPNPMFQYILYPAKTRESSGVYALRKSFLGSSRSSSSSSNSRKFFQLFYREVFKNEDVETLMTTNNSNNNNIWYIDQIVATMQDVCLNASMDSIERMYLLYTEILDSDRDQVAHESLKSNNLLRLFMPSSANTTETSSFTGRKIFLNMLSIPKVRVFLTFNGEKKSNEENQLLEDSFWLNNLQVHIENASLSLHQYKLTRALATFDLISSSMVAFYINSIKSQALGLLNTLEVTTLVASFVTGRVSSFFTTIMGKTDPVLRQNYTNFKKEYLSNDQIILKHSNFMSNIREKEEFVKCIHHLIFDWDSNHTGMEARGCVVLGIVNSSRESVLVHPKLHEGANIHVLPAGRTHLTSGSASGETFDPNSCMILIAYGYTPTFLTSGDAYFTLQSNAFTGNISRKTARVKPSEGYSASFIDQNIQSWWSRHILMISNEFNASKNPNEAEYEELEVLLKEKVLGIIARQDGDNCVRIRRLVEDSCAYNTGMLRDEDQIVSMNGIPVYETHQFKNIVVSTSRPLIVRIRRRKLCANSATGGESFDLFGGPPSQGNEEKLFG